MLPPCRIVPATCELCGNWLPDHTNACPRNGVHPSQWTISDDHQEDEKNQNDILSHFTSTHLLSPSTTTFQHD
ncbi:unnamed protein product [Cunninghamella blakesleeana]